jgi:hypothetical protein
MVYGLWRALPGVPGLLASVARKLACELDPSIGGTGPRAFAVRAGFAHVSRKPRASTAPRFQRRDGRDAPLDGNGMRRENHKFAKIGSGIFFAGGLDIIGLHFR